MSEDLAYLKHILDAIRAIEDYTKDMTSEKFIQSDNGMMQDAVVRELEIIGEAVRKLSDDIKTANPDLSWRDIEGMRNKLIHEYFGVEMKIVWKTVESNLPVLKKTAQGLLTKF